MVLGERPDLIAIRFGPPRTFEIRWEEGDQYLVVTQRQGGPKSKLVAIGPNVFTYENDPGSTLTFDLVGGRANAIRLVRGDGTTADGKRAN